MYMKLIELQNKKGEIVNHAQVDDEDYEWLSKWNWTFYTNKRGHCYAESRIEKGKKTKMHRLILGLTDPKIMEDHINDNGLDNQRLNLRKASNGQNNSNRHKFKNKYLGVSKKILRDKNTGKVWEYWYAQCKHDKKVYAAPVCKTEIEAALAYNVMAIKYHGEFARLNVITNEDDDIDIDQFDEQKYMESGFKITEKEERYGVFL